MIFYFYNSYQGSPTGFQMTCWQNGMDKLERIRTEDIPSADLRSLFDYGGNAYALGCDGNLFYFIVSDISYQDEDSRNWYSAFCVCADKAAEAEFVMTVRKILLNFAFFRKTYTGWFTATPEQELSYAINAAAVETWLSSLEQSEIPQMQHPVADQFRNMLTAMEQGITRRLFLLVPESTVAYFFRQNPVFDKTVPQYLFSDQDFQALLDGEPLPELENAEEKNDSQPIWEQLGISKELFIRYVLTGTILCVGFIGTIIHQIRKYGTRRGNL